MSPARKKPRKTHYFGIYKRMKHSTIERLMHYYHCIQAPQLWDHSPWVTSSQIAFYFNMDDTQVRKDLAEIGVVGRPRQGYKREEVIEAIRNSLGLNNHYPAVLIGAGRLGGAILEYKPFQTLGLSIVAAYDNDPEKVGIRIGGKSIQPIDKLGNDFYVTQPQLGILTCPSQVAQEIAEILVKKKIRAIWNFTMTSVVCPREVFVRNEHISVGLAEMCYFMNQK